MKVRIGMDGKEASRMVTYKDGMSRGANGRVSRGGQQPKGSQGP